MANSQQEKITELASKKLPTSSLERVGLTFFNLANIGQKTSLETQTDQLKESRHTLLITQLNGFHLHCIPGSGDLAPKPKKNQILAYVENNKLMVTYLRPNGDTKVLTIYNPDSTMSSVSPEDESLKRISSKVKSDRALNNDEISNLESKINSVFISLTNGAVSIAKSANAAVSMAKSATSTDTNNSIRITKNPLLISMDEYIQSLRKKANAEKIIQTAAKDKIALIKALIEFVENPDQMNWNTVRETMHTHSMYAFTATGQSQAYTYLNTVKTLYKTQIDSFDRKYNAQHYWHSNNAWGQFFIQLGFLNYLFVIPEAAYNLISLAVNTVEYYWISHQLYNVTTTVMLDDKFNETRDDIMTMTANLQAYLDESPDQVNVMLKRNLRSTRKLTQDEVIDYIDNFHDELKNLRARKNDDAHNKVYNTLVENYGYIRELIGDKYTSDTPTTLYSMM